MGWELAALGFGPDRIRTLVSMAKESSHRIIMGENLVTTLAPSFLIGSSLFLQVMKSPGWVLNSARSDLSLGS